MTFDWYTHAVIYAVDVEIYMDSDGDGVGDFRGLAAKLDYLSGLGINCLWIRPFFLSPLKDDGYDVQDYYQVDPRFGTLGDFAALVQKAQAVGIRIIIDLVVNHTSNKHQWFQKARKSPNSSYRNYYIWADKPVASYKTENVLAKKKIWTYDKAAKQYYLHHFLKEEPDLNVSAPEVREEILKIAGFWIQMGVCGFRVDAAHILVKEISNDGLSPKKMLDVLDELKHFVIKRNSEALLLAEANVEPKKLKRFFGNGKRMDLLFNFLVNQNIFLALARNTATPVISALKKIRKAQGRWVNFIRHHDELNLEMLTPSQRDEVFAKFAPLKKMRLFGDGIRRRLPPMLNGDMQQIRFMYSLIFGLPGIPMLNYGEEIIMGEDLSEKGRMSVRTIMQWDNVPHAGFSNTRNSRLDHAAIKDGPFGYKKNNVAAQQRDPRSFLLWMQSLISCRKQCYQLSYGEWDIVATSSRHVLAISCHTADDRLLLLYNFSSESREFTLKKFPNHSHFIEIFTDERSAAVGDIQGSLQLSAFGYKWLKSDLLTKRN